MNYFKLKLSVLIIFILMMVKQSHFSKFEWSNYIKNNKLSAIKMNLYNLNGLENKLNISTSIKCFL